MADALQRLNPNFVAAIKAGAKVEKVAVAGMSMRGCTARLKFAVNRQEKAVLQLFEKQSNGKFSGYKPISATIETVTPKKAKDMRIYEVQLRFNNSITANHGVVQALQAPQNTSAANDSAPASRPQQVEVLTPVHVETSLEKKSASIFIVPVTCHMCGQQHIPFRSLQSRTMEGKTNIFGVPQYKKALPGKEFCDYNLMRVTVCPACHFASGNATDFIKEKRAAKDIVEAFDKGPIAESWAAGFADRRKAIQPHLGGIFEEERTFEQALASYDMAIITCNEIMKGEMQKKERARNFEVARKAVFYKMIKAEMLMDNKKPKEADSLLREAMTQLQEIFPFLVRESSIKAAFLLSMLGLYFEDNKVVSQNVSFLQQYDKNNNVRFGSDEQKSLATSLKQINEAYQNRGDFSRKNLSGFNRPY